MVERASRSWRFPSLPAEGRRLAAPDGASSYTRVRVRVYMTFHQGIVEQRSGAQSFPVARGPRQRPFTAGRKSGYDGGTGA